MKHCILNLTVYKTNKHCIQKIGWTCVFYITNEMQLIQCSLLLSTLYVFRAVFPPIVRSS